MPDLDSETDSIDAKGRNKVRGHERRCIVTRRAFNTEDLIRFVAGPDGVVPDLKARLPGRGAWVKANAETVRDAGRKGHFARALKTRVKVSPDLDRTVGALLETSALNGLGMAGGQGVVETGFSKVDAGLRARRYALVLFASDGAGGSRAKLLAGMRAGGDPAPPLYCGFTSDQMSLALGRANVIHAGLVSSGMAAAVTKALRRLDEYWSGGAMSGPGA
ncbi:COG2740: Predicted nucleic-acid-binding protein implicated in transcription termination / Ribosomal protein L7Ae family protein YlxQ [hydrothermal vent metagenome]|uniref:COG2740: Predicted nucleic-acid-binding protein implicated in transcription termination / Ribosomal protein L7Ae family protein YlxQ n=1 Tax=hydrothermal vent metagenome TaxID=652676 RepID=A0A3B0TS62_9ZZZZ